MVGVEALRRVVDAAARPKAALPVAMLTSPKMKRRLVAIVGLDMELDQLEVAAAIEQ